MMLDEKYNVHLIEVNIMPSLSCTTSLDKAVKYALVENTLCTAGATPFHRKRFGDVGENPNKRHPRYDQLTFETLPNLKAAIARIRCSHEASVHPNLISLCIRCIPTFKGVHPMCILKFFCVSRVRGTHTSLMSDQVSCWGSDWGSALCMTEREEERDKTKNESAPVGVAEEGEHPRRPLPTPPFWIYQKDENQAMSASARLEWAQ